MKKRKIIFLFFIFLWNSGCGGGGGGAAQGNRAPLIVSVNSSPAGPTVSPGAIVNLICNAYDPDQDELTYSWIPTKGEILGTGKEVIWKAPDTYGECRIDLTVSDNKGGEVSTSLYFFVSSQNGTGSISIQWRGRTKK